MQSSVKAVLRGGCTGFDAAVREANSSPAGRRNGGAMLLALASEKALLTTLVRVATAESVSDDARPPHAPARHRACPTIRIHMPLTRQESQLHGKTRVQGCCLLRAEPWRRLRR